MIKKLFRKNKEKKLDYNIHVETFTVTPQKTKSIVLTDEQKGIISVEQSSEFINTMELKIDKSHVKMLHKQLNEIMEFCNQRNYYFSISPLINALNDFKHVDAMIDLGDKSEQVYDISLYFDNNEIINSFDFGTRKRFYAYAGEPPKIFHKTDLDGFNKVVDFMKKEL